MSWDGDGDADAVPVHSQAMHIFYTESHKCSFSLFTTCYLPCLPLDFGEKCTGNTPLGAHTRETIEVYHNKKNNVRKYFI